MRTSRFTLAVVAGAAACLVPVSLAQAADHLQRISEVMLTNGGSSAQFVQLRDPGNEPFSNAPYKLVAYDTAGNPGTEVTLNNGDPGAALNDWTVMSSEAQSSLGVNGNQTTPLGLDPVNGQVCFRRDTTPITCVNWGNVSTVVSGSSFTNSIPTPADGQSVSLCSGTYTITTPTPKAANACPSSGGGGGTPGGGTPGTPGTGTTPPQASVSPKLELAGAGSSRLKKSLSIVVECPNAPCLASAKGTLSVPNASKTFKIKSNSAQIAQGGKATLKIKLSKKARRVAKAALRKRKKVRAKLTVTATNSAGSATAKKTIRLKR